MSGRRALDYIVMILCVVLIIVSVVSCKNIGDMITDDMQKDANSEYDKMCTDLKQVEMEGNRCAVFCCKFPRVLGSFANFAIGRGWTSSDMTHQTEIGGGGLLSPVHSSTTYFLTLRHGKWSAKDLKNRAESDRWWQLLLENINGLVEHDVAMGNRLDFAIKELHRLDPKKTLANWKKLDALWEELEKKRIAYNKLNHAGDAAGGK